jgi:hypothetical protein
MIPMRRLSLVLLLAAVSSGCLRSTTTIDLGPDGAGTIVQETAVTAQALAMMKGFAAQQGAPEPPNDLFGEEQARKTAETMGVTFVSGEPIKTAEMEGYRARYSFDDIRNVKVTMQQGAAGMSNAKQPPFGFAFDRGAAASLLTIQIPDQMPGGGTLPGLPSAGTTDAEKAQAAQAIGMMKMMMRGMFVDVSLNVNGRILESNAAHIDGSRVTLLQIDVDKLLADESALQKLQAATDLKGLAGVPGLKVPTEPKVTIQFSR